VRPKAVLPARDARAFVPPVAPARVAAVSGNPRAKKVATPAEVAVFADVKKVEMRKHHAVVLQPKPKNVKNTIPKSVLEKKVAWVKMVHPSAMRAKIKK